MRVEVVFQIEEFFFSGRKHWLDTAFRHRISGRRGTDECTKKLFLFGLLWSLSIFDPTNQYVALRCAELFHHVVVGALTTDRGEHNLNTEVRYRNCVMARTL